MKEQILLAVIGLSAGFVISGGVIALLVGLGAITRFVGLSRTAGKVWLYEDAILLGSLFGNWLTVYGMPCPLGNVGLVIFGICSGIYVGGWILTLAEIANIFPIVARRVGITKGLSLVVIAVALGETAGSLIHFFLRW